MDTEDWLYGDPYLKEKFASYKNGRPDRTNGGEIMIIFEIPLIVIIFIGLGLLGCGYAILSNLISIVFAIMYIIYAVEGMMFSTACLAYVTKKRMFLMSFIYLFTGFVGPWGLYTLLMTVSQNNYNFSCIATMAIIQLLFPVIFGVTNLVYKGENVIDGTAWTAGPIGAICGLMIPSAYIMIRTVIDLFKGINTYEKTYVPTFVLGICTFIGWLISAIYIYAKSHSEKFAR